MKFLIKIAILGGLIFAAFHFTDYEKNVRYGYDIHTLTIKPIDGGFRVKMKKTGAELWKLESGKETLRYYTFGQKDK